MIPSGLTASPDSTYQDDERLEDSVSHMRSTPTQCRFLTRLVAVVLALAIVLMPFHAHSPSAAIDGASVSVSVSDLGPDAGEGQPAESSENCHACSLAKQIRLADLTVAPVVIASSHSMMRPGGDGVSPKGVIFDTFRPPIGSPV